jgi:hypothetical protein
MIAPFVPCDRTDALAPADRTDPNEPAEPTENPEPKDPIEPIDTAEPTEPIARNEPFDPIERNDDSDQSDRLFIRASYPRRTPPQARIRAPLPDADPQGPGVTPKIRAAGHEPPARLHEGPG